MPERIAWLHQRDTEYGQEEEKKSLPFDLLRAVSGNRREPRPTVSP